jgi:hypothetical protein
MGEEGGKMATEKGGFCSKTRSKRADAKEAKTEVGPSTRRVPILRPNAYLLDVLRSLKSAVKDLVSHGRERFASEKARPLFRP